MSEAAESELPPDLRKGSRKTWFSEAAPRVDRLPPHSPESEQGVLGCILLSPNDCIPEVAEKLKAGGDEFYDLRHRTIWDVVSFMHDTKVPIDTITLMQRLKDVGQLENIGGIAYLATLPDTVPSAANLGYYLEIVVEKYILRRLISTCTEVVGRVYDHEGEVDSLLDEVEREILRVGDLRRDASKIAWTKIGDCIKTALTTIEDAHQNKGSVKAGLTSGFPDLDNVTNGMKPGEMIVIAARPSVGKTSMAFQIAEHVAVDCKVPVGFFSLEMSNDSLTMRALCSRARVNIKNITEGFLAERDFPRLTGAAGKLSTAPIYLDDSSGITVTELRAKARRMVKALGIKLFVIDYMGRLSATVRGRRIEHRQQEMSEISSQIKDMAKELNVPVIVLNQLNRDIEKEKQFRRPRLSDLRESGSIEQDADLVAMLYKVRLSDADEPDDQAQDYCGVNMFIAKQRNGPSGMDIHLMFLKSYTRFESRAKITDDDVPTEAQPEMQI